MVHSEIVVEMTDRLTLLCSDLQSCGLVFRRHRDKSHRVTVEELHSPSSPFLLPSFLSSLSLCIYADDKLPFRLVQLFTTLIPLLIALSRR